MTIRFIKWAVVIILAVNIIVIAFWAITPYSAPPWTGFAPYDEKINGPRAKTFWDWLDLLIVPIFLAAGAWWLNRSQKRTEQQVETDRQRQNTLDTYFDYLANLLLKEKLRYSTDDSEVRIIARTRTLAVLRNLDGERKGQILQFLYESGLINIEPIIKLTGANLKEAGLNGASLIRAELRGVYLNNADLQGANLTDVDFRGTDLGEANLTDTNLANANLRQSLMIKTKVCDVDLRTTNLSIADLSGANLKGAQITDDMLNQIASLKNTIMPNGKRHN